MALFQSIFVCDDTLFNITEMRSTFLGATVLLSGQIIRKGFMPSPQLMGFARTVVAVTEQDRGYHLFSMDDISLSVMNGITLLTREIEILALSLIRAWLTNFIDVHAPILEMKSEIMNGVQYDTLEELFILAEFQNINLYREAIQNIEMRLFCVEFLVSVPQCSADSLSYGRTSHLPC